MSIEVNIPWNITLSADDEYEWEAECDFDKMLLSGSTTLKRVRKNCWKGSAGEDLHFAFSKNNSIAIEKAYQEWLFNKKIEEICCD